MKPRVTTCPRCKKGRCVEPHVQCKRCTDGDAAAERYSAWTKSPAGQRALHSLEFVSRVTRVVSAGAPSGEDIARAIFGLNRHR